MAQLKLSTQAWTSQTIFILAAIGSAVGLGNLWKFPYITGENGGGAFVIVYLLCILLIGLPILIAEITLGRAGKASPPQAIANIVRETGSSKLWVLLGFNAVMGGLLILTFYSVIAGWGIAYFVDSLFGVFSGMNADQAQQHFDDFVASPSGLTFWHSVVMLLTILIVVKGVRSGIERAINIMMPGLLIILLVLLGYATTTGALGQSFEFLFKPNFSALTTDSVLIALGHAFFTLSLGFGTMMVYGSYMPKDYSIVRASLWIVAADTIIALIAGLVIFSIVFGNGLEAGSGPGLLFQTLPIAFGQMTGGWFFGTLFFGMVVFAALSSAISMIEPAISWLEQNWGFTRRKAAWTLGLFSWTLGLGSVLSFNLWKNVHFLQDKTFFGTMDFLTSNVMLPLGGMFTALFVGWVWTQQQRDGESGMPPKWSNLYGVLVKFVAPVLVFVVFVESVT
ncbi:sodium-dependent transporter [Hydrogenovibrio thermophilus]|jgi:NSS family neurotransmitter:Na+ symporter|uniref:Transporter n=1 Tax=Hydrogenovibrio thermophilus TaxID=265883 RepID=A0A410H3Q8_9GAMM|nr:sodium-dependent transporter [Hydrogenovibrio thermophilus]QAB15450.1 sodium-dependent transporter [Hydrogenovibrio thermophilus]